MKKHEKDQDKPNKRAKRNFACISQDGVPFVRVTRQKLNKNKAPKLLDYFCSLPENAIKAILTFLPLGTLKQIKFLNKDFYLYVSQMYTKINFEKKSEIPLEVLESIMRNCLKPREVRFGRLNKLKSQEFSKKIVVVMNLQEIKILDFSMYSELNDEILLKCLEKMTLSKLNELNLPYNCKITNKSLQFIEENIAKLRCFHFDSKYSSEANKQIDQKTLANIIIKNPKLSEVVLTNITIDFLEAFNENNYSSENLLKIKIRNLDLKELKDIRNITSLGDCPNLQSLAIMEIFIKNKIIDYSHDEIQNNFRKLFQKLDSLRALAVGHFTNSQFLDLITENLRRLLIFKVVSESLEIEDLENFFFTCFSLISLKGRVGLDYKDVRFQKRKLILIF